MLASHAGQPPHLHAFDDPGSRPDGGGREPPQVTHGVQRPSSPIEQPAVVSGGAELSPDLVRPKQHGLVSQLGLKKLLAISQPLQVAWFGREEEGTAPDVVAIDRLLGDDRFQESNRLERGLEQSPRRRQSELLREYL